MGLIGSILNILCWIAAFYDVMNSSTVVVKN